jgi:hypothetical protein
MSVFLAGFASGLITALGFKGLMRRRPKCLAWKEEWDR